MNCIKNLCICLPTLANLATLDLRGTGLGARHVAELTTIFTPTTNAVMQNLQCLNLSDNILGDRSLKQLSIITKHLKLTNLNLSNVKFTSNLLESNNDDSKLNLENIQVFDISDNSLESVDIMKILRWMDFGKLRKLNLSKNVRKAGGILRCINELLEGTEGHKLENLNISRCMVQETELYEFLRLVQPFIYSINFHFSS